MNKDIIFYSNYDDYSKKIIDLIKKNSIKDILPLCIDDSKIKIPTFITMVPTIYTYKSKELLIDEEIQKYIDKKILEQNQQIDSLNSFNLISVTDNFHDIDLNKKEIEGDGLDEFFKENQKLDEKQILEKRDKNMDSLSKSRAQDISNIFNK